MKFNNMDLTGIESRVKRHVGTFNKIGSSVRIPLHLIDRADVGAMVDDISKELIVTIYTYIESMENSTKRARVWKQTEVPSGWWNHVKHDLFPAWLKRKFPVKYDKIDTLVEETVTNTNICPYLDSGVFGKQQYFEFLVHGGFGTDAKNLP